MRGKRGKPEKLVGNYKSGCMGASYSADGSHNVCDHHVNNTRGHWEMGPDNVFSS